MKRRRCKFKIDNQSNWENGYFHGFHQIMESDHKYNETFLPETIAIIENNNGVLHNMYFCDWERYLMLEQYVND